MPIRIEFEELGNCIEFVDLVLRNPELPLKRRDLQVEAYSEDDQHTAFAVTIEDASKAAASTLLCLARCEGFQTPRRWPHGERLSINELLERVQLVRQPNTPSGHPLSVLLFNASDGEFRRHYTELLEMHCQGIRVGLVEACPANQGLTHVILVETPPPTFWPPGAWLEPTGDLSWALACYRVRADADCRLYVQWGHEYPCERVEHLYDFGHPSCHSIFALKGFAEGTQLKPQWLRVREEDYQGIYSLGSQLLKVEAELPLPVADLQPSRSSRGLALNFRIQHQARSTSCSLEALETQIAHHQQAIAELQRDYRIAHALRHQAIYLAYVFEQDLGGDEGSPLQICTTFARFLEQPYNQLKHMDYAFYEVPQDSGPARALHVIFDPRPESHGRVLTSLADEVYVQRDEWAEWGLPVFIRNGDDLRPRLDDQEFADKIKGLFWESKHPGEERVLLRALEGRPGGDGGSTWEAMYVRETSALVDSRFFQFAGDRADSSSLQFLNDRFRSPIVEFRPQVPLELERVLEDARTRVTERCDELERQILQAVQERIGLGREKWQQVDQRIDEVLRKTGQYDQEISDAQAAITVFPGVWAAFVDRVLTAHANLHQVKIDAAETYGRAQRAVEEAQEKHETALLDVKRQVEQDIAAVKRREVLYDTVETEAGTLLEDLTRKVAEFHKLQRQIEPDLTKRRDQAEKQVRDVGKQLSELQTQRTNLQNKLLALEKQQADLGRERQAIEALMRELDDAQHGLKAQQKGLEENLEKLARQREETQTLRDQIEERRESYERENPIVEADLSRLRKEKEDLDTKLTGLETKRNLLDHEKRELESTTTEVADQEEKLRRREEQNVQLRDRVGARRQECDRRERELGEASAVLQEEQRKVDEREAQLKEQQRQNDEQLTDMKARQSELEHQLAEEKRQLEATIDQLNEQLAAISGRRASVRTLLEKARTLRDWLAQRTESVADEETVDLANVQVYGVKPAELLEEMRKRLMQSDGP